MAADNKQLARGRRLAEVAYFRATALRVFERCSRSWQERFLRWEDGAVEAENEWAAIGTAAHNVIEAWLKAWASGTQVEAGGWEMAVSVVPERERPALVEYVRWLASLAAAGWRPYGIEAMFEVPLLGPDLPPIRMHIDLMLVRGTELWIIDHKTTRAHKSTDHWKDDLQPRIYALTAWTLMTEASSLPGAMPAPSAMTFTIGQINTMQRHTWEADEAYHAETWSRLEAIAERLRWLGAAPPELDWPAAAWDECSFCHIKDRCAELHLSMQSLQGTFIERAQRLAPHERIEWLKGVEKAAAAMREAEEKVLAEQIEAGGGRHVAAGWAYALKERGQRKAAPGLLGALMVRANEAQATGDATPMTALWEALPGLATVKVTALDELRKVTPAFDDVIETGVTKEPIRPAIVPARVAGAIDAPAEGSAISA